MALAYPSLIPGVFAAQANDHAAIPDTDADEGRMAWDVGFPAETSQPIAAGGVPPRRLDMNGLGNRLSQHILWLQSGGLYNWNASLDYPAGAHVLGSNGQEYIALAANGPSTSNAMDPVSDVNFTVWKSFARSLVDIIYPVGSIYMSANNASPATLFGGSWTRIQGRFLLAAGGNYALGSQGGAATVMLTVENMPAHNHGVTVGNNTHSHGVTIAAKTISATTGSTSITHNHAVTFPQTTFANATSNTGEHMHTRGTMNITGKFDANDLTDDRTTPTASGAMGYVRSSKPRESQDGSNTPGYAITFDAKDGWTGSTSSNGNHRHNITIPATSMTCGNAGGSHTHSVSVTVPAQTVTSASNTHTHTVTVSSAGGGAAFSIMPPYLAVNVWQRTA